MISRRHKCIFVHITKAGGSSVENLLWRRWEKREKNLWMGFVDKYSNRHQTGGLQHLTAALIKQEVGEEIWENYFKFTIVRNPYSRILSQFKYMKSRPDLREWIGMSHDTSFLEYLSLIQRKVHVQWMPQSEFVYNDSGSVMVDYIGRLENMEESMGYILDKISYKSYFSNSVKIPHRNRSKESGKSSNFYCAESVEIVQNLYQDDFNNFDYDMNDVSAVSSTTIGKLKA